MTRVPPTPPHHPQDPLASSLLSYLSPDSQTHVQNYSSALRAPLCNVPGAHTQLFALSLSTSDTFL